MNKALKLIIMYVVFSVICIVLGTAFYMLYQNVLNYAAGRDLLSFSKYELLRVFFFISACVVFLVCPLISYFRIRQRGGLFQLIVYLIVCALTWLIIFPVVLKAGDKFDFLGTQKERSHVLTSGYFRTADDNIYYFFDDLDSNEYGKNKAQCVVINSGEPGGVEVTEFENSAELELYKQAEPYNDILIKKTFYGDGIFKYLNLRLLISKGIEAWQKGWTFWLGFLSLAVVLCAVYGLSNFFNWKLIDACMVLFSSALILICNTMYYHPGVQAFMDSKIYNKTFFANMQSVFDAPFLVLVNLLFALIFIIIGIVKFFSKKSKME
ncbi:MAG: hypothetical protein MJ160_05500 [Treponema sp.]|nr:hypothetical protein [Treponema sp.]